MKTLKKLQLVFLVLSAYFIFRFLSQSAHKINLDQLSFDPLNLFLAMIFTIASFFFLVGKIKALYESELPVTNYARLFKTVAKTNLYRYLPGGIWNHAGLALEAASDSGKSLKTTTKLQFLNIAFMVYVGLIFLFFVLPYPINLILLVALVIGLLSLNQLLTWLNRLWKSLKFKQELTFIKFEPKELANIFANNLLFWLFNGLSFVYFLKGIGLINEVGLVKQLYLGASYILAWIAGFLFLPAPAGLGVREAVLGYFLDEAGISLALGVSVSLLYRLFILIRDLGMFVFSLFVRE
ncbi:hypothetical protein A2313_00580 [Candidatus Roizmanbacteria bacterium RIFOXYB2_FULL_41_10]|uniref:Flippase-like domain-containing protein n=1 Tax=Candidatus Roizmanbacteria bacterium RIFOXYA1_FULL_41_12 TaxID=1802082 RepID=A0A1F7KAH9_9BACT|nr:MAG: hypothetical protein A2209_04140 [Candidatus Roizmanbacteria bacterium RIFOXYA1_FULL_41_12]OGK66875.1 MAG: hypothetical protein A2377_03185 [Candidatus Roizmanbacteria bacterium RIFOXYB1_FULL_41_27]OGK68869.1 MAG: hypothetical protein A2262_00585 [Candidatus Roizmanbacteria bacterium RIFOXYA2_FULL_41_8]OGK70751.1 MAG: hypothetical protein A2403_01520 [Candidatus Roizmanbacteria bacterium RIFOXYC1_FULL_41_16]OGK71457.1 MAG: hypothetical protein A2313_00580 [Candidatus Roizmanbacteria bac